MFSKKCPKCNHKIGKSYDFCQSCGANLKSDFNKEDYGLLGRNDLIKEREPDFLEEIGLGGLPFGKILKGAMKELPSIMKMLEKQMEDFSNESARDNQQNKSNLNVQFFVNGKRVEPVINKNKHQSKKGVERIQIVQKELSKEKMKMLAKFPKVEPKSEIRRFSGRIVYNLHIPGVKDREDIFINQLENSIEIKALGEDKVYSKTLKLNLPLISYELIKDNLVLELSTE